MKDNFIRKNKWLLAFIATAVVLVATIIVATVLVTMNKSPDSEQPPVFEAEGSVGVYYYDVADGEILLTLSENGTFTIAENGSNIKTGTYSVGENGSIVLDYIRDEDGTATATINGNSIQLPYGDATLIFTKKIEYTMSFSTDGGSDVSAIKVINGKTANKPADPAKEGYAFVGWYSDAAFTTPYDFSSATVSADTTLYARWIKDQVGVGKYVIDFDLGYENAPTYENVTTISGLAYNLPTPERTGYTFGGWWISMYEDGSKLSYKYTEDTVFNSNTTLYAVWVETAGTKLASPLVNISGNSISWDSVANAISYKITITDPNGTVVVNNESVAATTKSFDFAGAGAGDYVISVVAVSANAENNSEETTRYFANKTLAKVSQFNVIDGMLIYNAVDGATRYLVTVDCGNDAHDHTSFNNGTNTSFSLLNCPMQVGGIKITVTAEGAGFASSYSETFVYDRTLSPVNKVVYDNTNDRFSWDEVANVRYYAITVTVGNETYTFNNGTKTSFDTSAYSGEIAITVTPVNEGFNSPAATAATHTKTAPATPTGLTISGMTVSWNAAPGATKYEIRVGNLPPRQVTGGTSFNLDDLGANALTVGEKYAVSVKAINDSASSKYSDEVEIGYRLMNPTLVYENKTIYWTPVIGVSNYEIRINGDSSTILSVSGANSAAVVLTKEGVNKIEVRFTDFGGSTWASTEVVAYSVTYMPRNGATALTEYLAVGDTMTLPADYTYLGYNFTAWYTSPAGAVGNGKSYAANSVFAGTGTTVLYADWDPVVYNIVLNTEGYDITNITDQSTTPAKYTKDFTISIPVSSNAALSSFAGWFTGPNGTGTQLTDAEGNALNIYSWTRDQVAYPFFDTGILTFILKGDNTYSVTRGPNFDSVANVVIPTYYNGIPVTTIADNAFASRTKLVTIEIPDTIKIVGTGAFSGCTALTDINVYEVEGNHDVFYGSDQGALIRYDMGTTYLELFPRAKTGTYVMSDEIQVIRNKAFQYADINKVVIGKGVTTIIKYGFYYCYDLAEVEFAEGRTNSIIFEDYAWIGCSALKTVKLPATLAMDPEDLTFVLSYMTKLETITIESGSQTYSTVSGMLTNAARDTIIYCPALYTGVDGVFTVPQGITAIGPEAFYGRKSITEIVIPAYVESIGESAFQSCTNVEKITFNGSRRGNLSIGDYAFASMQKLKDVVFKGNAEGTLEVGVTTIGAYAFAPYIVETTTTVNGVTQKAGDIITALKTLTFEPGVNVSKIGDHAFENQPLLYSIVYGENAKITEFGSYAFANNILLDKITIPATTTMIGDHAFAGCTKVTEVTLVEGAEEVVFGMYAFQNCESLLTIYLPASVRDFDGSAFDGCDSIRMIEVAAGNPYLQNDEKGILYQMENGVEKKLLFYPRSIVKDNNGIVNDIIDTVTEIGGAVFANNTYLTEIHIGKNVTVLGEKAFSYCTKLVKVIFEEGGTDLKVGNYAFSNCTSLVYGTTATTVFELPAYTSSIGAYAFEYCTFAGFTIPESVTTIGEGAFYTNKKLTKIEIPLNVRSIGNKAFSYCTTLTTFTVKAPTATPYNGLVLGLVGVGAKEDGVFYGSSKLATVNLGNRVVSIGDNAFYGITTLKGLDLGDALVDIGSYAFYDSGLTAIEIPANVERIRSYAFGASSTSNAKLSATGLTFEIGGAAPLEIYENAFQNQKTVTSITLPYRTTLLYSISNPYGSLVYKNVDVRFTGMAALAAINVEEAPAGKVAKFASLDGVLYETDENGKLVTLLYCPVANTGKDGSLEIIIPKTVTTVSSKAFRDITKLKTITFEEFDKETESEFYGQPLLSIGEGSYTSYSYSKTYGVFGGVNTNTITTINLPSHLGYIANGGFTITKDPITLTFNAEATSIDLDHCAFAYCKATTIDVPNVSKIGNYTFYYCDQATSINYSLTGKLTEIPNYTFYYCTALESYFIPAGVTTIGNSAFSNCTSLKTVVFEEGSKCELIGNWAFSNCGKLESINLTACTMLGSIGQSTALTGDGSTFQNCVSLKEIDLSKCTNLTVIAFNSFSGCTGLQSFVFPENLENVGYDILENCTGLKEVTLSKTFSPQMFHPMSGTAVKTNFFGCTDLEKLIIPEDNIYFVTDEFGAIYDKQKTILYFFPPAADATGYTIPATVKEIAPYAFAFYPGNSLVLPEGLEKIGNYAFYFNKFETIHIPASVISIGSYVFTTDGSLTDASGEEYRDLYTSKLHTVTFGENSKLESLGGYAFYYATKLETINLPDSVKTIGTYAFRYCDSLKKIVVPAGVKELSATYIFSDCDFLEEIVLQEGLELIGNYAFYYSGSQAGTDIRVTIPSTVKTIGDYVFDYSYNLAELTFTKGSVLESIGNYAFRSTKLERVVLPSSLTTISSNAFFTLKTVKHFEFTGTGITELPNQFFKGYTNLETVVLPSSLTTIGSYAFSAPPSAGGGKLDLLGGSYDPCKSLKSITIPASVTSIGNSAFENCESLETVIFEAGSTLTTLGADAASETNIFKNTPALRNVTLPSTLEVIGGHAFENSGVAEINLPNTLTTIGDYAFANCDNLTKVDLFANISYLGNYAFYDCNGLVEATPSFGLEFIGALAFGYCDKLTEAYIPATVTQIMGNPYVGCSSVAAFQLDPDNSFYLTDATGALYDLNMTTLIYYPASIADKEVVLPDTVNEIAAGAFSGARMEKITIPARLSKVYANTFRGCPNLTTVVFEYGLKEIESYAFADCAKLNNVEIPKTLDTIGSYAFANCTSLTTVTFEETNVDNPYTLYPHIFEGCTAMTTLQLPSNWVITADDYKESTGSTPSASTVLSNMLPSYMFANTGIVDLVVPAQVTSLHTLGVFMNCKDLKTVRFEALKMIDSVIGDYYFYGCESLKEFEAAPSPDVDSPFTSIKGYSFAFCSSLEKFTCYYTTSDLLALPTGSPTNHFEGCTSLKEVNICEIAVIEDTADSFKFEVVGYFTNYQQPSMFKDCASLTEFAFADKCTISKNMFEGCSGLTEISLMPSYLYQEAFKDCTGIKNAYLYPYVLTTVSALGKPSTSFSRFYENAFAGWTAEQNIYVMTMTRNEFIAMLALNTATTAASIDDVFAGCNANIYFKDDILAMNTINVGTLNSLFTSNFFTGTTAEQTINIKGHSYKDIYKVLDTTMFTGCLAKVCDKDGNVLTYDGVKKLLTVTNASNEVIALYYYGAATVEELAALELSTYTNLEFVYLANIGFGNIATLQGDATEFDALKGCNTVFLDKDGAESIFDTTTGLLKTVTLEAKYVEVKSSGSSGGGLAIKVGKNYGLNITEIDFSMLKASVTVTITGITYEDMLAVEDKIDEEFAGCQATIYDGEGNKVVFNADGKIAAVYAPGNDTTPIYPVA